MLIRQASAILLFLLPLLAWAQGVYEHPGTKLRFPPTLEAFERTVVKRYDDPKLGVQVGYVAPGLGKADFYVFDYGLSGISEGISSGPVRSAYASADRDVHGFADAGNYLDFEQLIPLGSVMKPAKYPLEWYVAAYKFRPNREDSEPLISWLLVTGYRDQFLKIRFSHIAAKSQEGRTAVERLIEAFLDNNRP